MAEPEALDGGITPTSGLASVKSMGLRRSVIAVSKLLVLSSSATVQYPLDAQVAATQDGTP
ncbi:hypothetical protein GCM10027290_04610 [Micromonospora sonneratiae]|uniref:Uncharacterized protein n=1 Tax=Micromonospora sonneratiae TaxID=1184706 RepID=A0ABW3YJ70_9ACTN